MQSKAATVKDYLAELPADRREAIDAVRAVILKNLPKGYVEGMQYGMIGYFVPHAIYPAGYHCDPKQPLPFASLASQKNYMAVYLFCLYTEGDAAERFKAAWKATGKRVDMGKSCARFRKLDDAPIELIGKAVKRYPVKKFIEQYEGATKQVRKRPAVRKKKK